MLREEGRDSMQPVSWIWSRFQLTGMVPRAVLPWILPLAGILAIALAVTYQKTSTAKTTEVLLGGRKFSDSQVAAMAQAFQKSKLTEYAIRDGQIHVPRGQSHRFLAALAEREALPSDFQSHTDDAFRQNRFLESDRERQLRIRHAREKDLAIALRSMQGIENAMVQYDEVETEGFQRHKIVTACVAILPMEGHVLDRGQIRTIRQLVAWAKAGLKPSEVNVTDLRSGRAYVDAGEDEAAWPLAEEYLRVKRSVEKEWLQKIQQVLRFIPEAQVVVHVDLPEPSTSPTEDDLTRWADPKRIAVSVGVPESYLREVKRLGQVSYGSAGVIPPEALTDVTQQVQRRIEAAVEALLPNDAVTQSSVAVTAFADPSAPLSPWEEWRQSVLPMISSRHLGLGLLAWSGILIGLPWALRRARRRRRSAAIPQLRPFPDPSEHDLADQSVDEEEAEEEKLRATLTDLVRQDPDRAAQVLHRWIERAG